MEKLKPHSKEWYLRLATLQRGYYYPWKSHLPAYNGEDVYIQMVHGLLDPEKDVLDAGCGHGEFTLSLASKCRSIFGYDRVPAFIELAESARDAQNVKNARFMVWDSHEDLHGKGTIPAEDQSFDFMISRRGPINWLEDARRVGRPGAVLLQLNPNPIDPPAWNDELPECLRIPGPGEFTMRQSITRRLGFGGLKIHSCWTFEVPETFIDPFQLHVWLTWGQLQEDTPSWAEMRPLIESIFNRFGGSEGLEIRFSRFLWKAVVD